jgi:lipid-A-disaccharide synthase
VDSTTEPRFLIVAGEASGDAHAARMIRCLRALVPGRVRGVAGPALVAAGVEPIADMSDLAVVGFSGVLGRLPRIWKTYRLLLSEAERFRPDVAVLVDSPGFNFRVGPALKRRGIRIFYYIAPQVWAWHPERARAMRGWVDRLAVVFPFEEPLFRDAGVNVEFVGHPLLDGLEPEVDEATFRAELGASSTDRILGLLPGSRRQELRHHLRAMLDAAGELRRGRPDLVAVLPLAPGLCTRDLERAGLGRLESVSPFVQSGGRALPGFRLVRERTRAVQAYATACAVASGTATLETALFGTPLVAVYRVGRLNYAIARRLVTLSRIALPNIVADREVVPELLQEALTPARLAATLAPWLDDAIARAAARGSLAVVRERLGTPGASRRAAELLRRMVA